MARMTISDVARAAGVSRATVSYALNNHRKIPVTTRERIRAVADELGYRPDTTVARQLARMRRSERVSEPETLALVWLEQSSADVAGQEYDRLLRRGARGRAEALGYRMDEFHLREEGLSPKRLAAILKARGIRGALFGPVIEHSYAHLRLDWNDLAWACIGLALARPPLHRAVHNHYEGMDLCLRELRHAGYHRPALLLNELTHERCRRAWAASFVAHHPAGDAAALQLLRVDPAPVNRGEATAWLHGTGADVVIVEAPPDAAGLSGPIATLNWHPAHPEYPGVDQRYGAIAATAVDLLVSQFMSNESGLPELPKTVSVPPAWRDAGDCRSAVVTAWRSGKVGPPATPIGLDR